jgi:hypothetical protein
MPIPGSETYSSAEPAEVTKRSTLPSESAELPESVRGEDWPESPEPPEPEEEDPKLSYLLPDFIEVPGPDAYVILNGEGFTPEAVVSWDLEAVPCEFVDDSNLKVFVTTYTFPVENLPEEIPVAVEVGTRMSNTLIFTYKQSLAHRKHAAKDEPEHKKHEEKEVSAHKKHEEHGDVRGHKGREDFKR